MTHTPGPWHRNIPPATKYTAVWSGRNTHVAYVLPQGFPPEEVEANIKLIAAAPDLLAEAKNALYIFEQNGFADHAERLRTLIDKATK